MPRHHLLANSASRACSTWNAFCNATHIWFDNYDNKDCSGKSILTRVYETGKCINCPKLQPNCKNGPFPERKERQQHQD